MPHEAPRADHHHLHHRHAGAAHDHGAGVLHREPAHQVETAAAMPSPLWWSAPLRLTCAGVLSAALWLVIAWAVA